MRRETLWVIPLLLPACAAWSELDKALKRDAPFPTLLMRLVLFLLALGVGAYAAWVVVRNA